MSILIFVVAVLGALVLDRQERRHRFEKVREYERLKWEIPAEKPKLSMLESWGNLIVGVVALVLGGLLLRAMLGVPAEALQRGWENIVALFLASGLALSWLGFKAIRQNLTYRALTR